MLFFIFFQMPQNPLQLLVQFFPTRCACLKRWKVARRKCILCLANGAIYHCPRCGFSWCAECFTDVDQRCLHCLAEHEMKQKQSEVIGSSSPTSKNRTANATVSNSDQRGYRRSKSQHRHHRNNDDNVV